MPGRLAALLITAAVLVPGCGAQTPKPLPFSRWFSYDAGRRTVTLTMIPAYDNTYSGGNFNGYARGQVDVVIPLRWTVTVAPTARAVQGVMPVMTARCRAEDGLVKRRLANSLTVRNLA